MSNTNLPSSHFLFTFKNIEECFRKALENDYQVISCLDYYHLRKSSIQKKILINRVDIDLSIIKAERLATIFNNLKIKATFFIRLHASEYNPFSFENYRILKFIRDSGHEIGYHSEVIDQSIIWDESAEENLLRDIAVLEKILNISIKGVASHGGMTGLNNIDFWKGKKPEDFNLLYEAYEWFNDVLYISDSEWTKWKCYNKGLLVNEDNRSLGEVVNDGHTIINSTIHPETYFNRHFYE